MKLRLQERFEKLDTERLEFNKTVSKPFSKRPDLHALMLLDKLVPSTEDMITSAAHDQIWLNVDPQVLNIIISDEEIRELIAGGVFYDSEFDCLSMFR